MLPRRLHFQIQRSMHWRLPSWPRSLGNSKHERVLMVHLRYMVIKIFIRWAATKIQASRLTPGPNSCGGHKSIKARENSKFTSHGLSSTYWTTMTKRNTTPRMKLKPKLMIIIMYMVTDIYQNHRTIRMKSILCCSAIRRTDRAIRLRCKSALLTSSVDEFDKPRNVL